MVDAKWRLRGELWEYFGAFHLQWECSGVVDLLGVDLLECGYHAFFDPGLWSLLLPCELLECFLGMRKCGFV